MDEARKDGVQKSTAKVGRPAVDDSSLMALCCSAGGCLGVGSTGEVQSMGRCSCGRGCGIVGHWQRHAHSAVEKTSSAPQWL